MTSRLLLRQLWQTPRDESLHVALLDALTEEGVPEAVELIAVEELLRTRKTPDCADDRCRSRFATGYSEIINKGCDDCVRTASLQLRQTALWACVYQMAECAGRPNYCEELL